MYWVESYLSLKLRLFKLPVYILEFSGHMRSRRKARKEGLANIALDCVLTDQSDFTEAFWIVVATAEVNLRIAYSV